MSLSPVDALAMLDRRNVVRAATLDGIAHDLHGPIARLLHDMAHECRRDAEIAASVVRDAAPKETIFDRKQPLFGFVRNRGLRLVGGAP